MRTANPIERAIQQEIKRRTRKIRVFPNEISLERLATAILVEIDEEWTSTTRTYIKHEKSGMTATAITEFTDSRLLYHAGYDPT